MIIPVIMCGGAGTRLWPLSRETRPKPLLPLVDGTSTFAATLERVADAAPFRAAADRRQPRPSPHARRGARRSQAPPAGSSSSPSRATPRPRSPRRRSGSPATIRTRSSSSSPPTTSSATSTGFRQHRPRGARRRRVTARSSPSASGRPIPPTSYGYIERGEPLPDATASTGSPPSSRSPTRQTARALCRGRLSLEQRQLHDAGGGRAVASSPRTRPTSSPPPRRRSRTPPSRRTASRPSPIPSAPPGKISFDHAVMEKTARAAVIDAAFDWSDLGTWGSVWEAADKDEQRNVVQGDVTLVSASGNYVSSRPADDRHRRRRRPRRGGERRHRARRAARASPTRSRRWSPRSTASPRPLIGDRARHYRPWGYYQSIDIGPSHQVKRLVVTPGQRLSLQKHRHRSEHWTVVEGVAEVTIDDRILTLSPNESVYIPLGAVHRAANPRRDPGDASSRSSAATTSARTTSSASRTTTGGLRRHPPMRPTSPRRQIRALRGPSPPSRPPSRPFLTQPRLI